MLPREICADAPRAWLPVKPAPPALRQQIKLRRFEGGSNRYTGEAALQPEIPGWVEDQFAAVKKSICTVGKACDPAATCDDKPRRKTQAAFIINSKNIYFWPLDDPQGFFIDTKTVGNVVPKLNIESLSGTHDTISGCVSEEARIRLQPVRRGSLARSCKW